MYYDKLINLKKIKFVSEDFGLKIKGVIKNMFPSLNDKDFFVLNNLAVGLIDNISAKFGFEQKPDYYNQWHQNGSRDIKAAVLMLIPFMDDKDNSKLLRELKDLNQLLYAFKTPGIPKKLEEQDRNEILSTHFKFGNMGLGLLNYDEENSDYILDLMPENEPLIYKLLYYNYIALFQTLQMINHKLYVNWINTQPLNLENYKQSKIYLNTVQGLNDFVSKVDVISNQEFYDFEINYDGLWFGDFYNVYRIKLYQNAKKIK
jgi:hypothetical protein